MRSALSCALALVAFVIPAPAGALDVQLDTDTSFQIYEVRSPGARAFMARRRLLSRLGVRLSHDLTEPEPDGSAIRILADAQLRLEQEFGQTCLLDRELCVNAVDADDPGGWQPLAADTRLDVPSVWVGMSGLPLGTTVRVGRMLVLDNIGFARFDGGSVQVAPLRWARLEVFGGLLVRGTSLAATPRSEPQGAIRLDPERRVPWAAPPVDTGVIGGTLSGGPGRELNLSLGYRYMWEPAGDVVHRLSLAASSQPVDWLRLDGVGVWDLLTEEVIEARAGARVGEGDFSAHAQVSRHVPRFDPGTIWAWFNVAPINQAEVGMRWIATDDFSLGGTLKGRHAELTLADEDDLDAGFDGWIRARWEGVRFDLSGFVWSGSLGPLSGVSLGARRPILGWLEIGLDVSVWYFDNPNRQGMSGVVVSEALEGRVRISPETLVLLELQHAASEAVGNRFRGILALRVDTWR